MSFVIGRVGNAAKSVCSEPDCGRPFWHGIPKIKYGFVRTGMTPEQYEQFTGVKL